MTRSYTLEGAESQSDASSRQVPPRGVPWWWHAGAAAWIAGMLLYARLDETRYAEIVQEDRFVEWWTALLFLAAAVAFGRVAWRGRRLFDAGVALFCFAAAGEEVSWGQRLLGFIPADAFLERNAQQEANLHNLVEPFGQPKWTLVAILVAYGLLLPLAARVPPLRRLAAAVRATVPPAGLALWFATTIAVLVWYPVRFTGEWVEALAGALFLAAAPMPWRTTLAALGATALLAVGAERLSARTDARPSAVACAVEETRALLDGVLADTTSSLVQGDGSEHRRVWSLWRDGELSPAAGERLARAACAESRGLARRRRYAVDPWGTAYWVRTETEPTGARRITVYSFGPNRRRDDAGGDDVVASVTLR